jgi:hypothetical protein
MTGQGVGNPARVAVVVLVAALIAFQVVRTAAVADRADHPALAAAAWPSHPAVLTDRALLGIAVAAAGGQAVPDSIRRDVRTIAAMAPLSPDPFLIEGAIAETRGRGEASERLLMAARGRDPRSRGTRYLLAERFFRTGRITAALIEMQALVSLQSRGVEVFVPTLVAFARTPGAVPGLKAYFRKFPRIETAVLSILAVDPANADLVLALANLRDPEPDWRGTLVSALAAQGDYARAYATWTRLSGVRPRGALFNPGFAELAAPPPFNWAFTETGEGFAEPDGEGGLDVLYYGRARAVLASQLLLLSPGRYRLAMTIGGATGDDGAVNWILRCAGTNQVLADLPLKAGAITVTFGVPPGCQAQWLELQGLAGEMPRTSELKLSNLQLAAEAVR